MIKEKQGRNLSLDLLRILAMFLIVLGHSMIHSDVLDEAAANSFNNYATRTLYAFLYVHVNCFVLLSGYFSCTQKFSAKRLLKLWVPTVFWSVFLYAVFCLLGQTEFSFRSLIKAATPIVSNRYWFMTTFVLLYLLTPILNAAVSSLSKKEFSIALGAIVGVYIVLANFVFWSDFAQIHQNHVLFFVILYLCGAYFRKYPIEKKIPWVLFYVIISAFTALSYFMLPKLFGIGKSLFFTYNSVPVFAASVCLFAAFLNCKAVFSEKSAAVISFFAPLTFGVYLIHDNPELRPIIWKKLFSFSKYLDSPLLIPILIGAAIIVFVACSFAEKLRRLLSKAFFSLFK